MTLAELNRAIDSKKRVQKARNQEQAYFDYTLAELIGRSIARIYSSSTQYPSINDAYPTLFESESIAEKAQKRRDELSVIRLKQFTQSFNKRFKEVGD